MIQYAVQIKWPDGDWMFVTVSDPETMEAVPEVFPTKERAESAASIWKHGSTRIMKREVMDWTPLS